MEYCTVHLFITVLFQQSKTNTFFEIIKGADINYRHFTLSSVHRTDSRNANEQTLTIRGIGISIPHRLFLQSRTLMLIHIG